MQTTPRPWFIRRYNGDLTIQGQRGEKTVAILMPCQLSDARLMLKAVNTWNPDRDKLALELAVAVRDEPLEFIEFAEDWRERARRLLETYEVRQKPHF